MHLEYCYYDTASKDAEIIENISKAMKLNAESISVLPPYVKLAKSNLSSFGGINVSTPIDFPLGIMDTNSRLSVAENAIKNGATIIEVVCPTQYLCNRKYDKFREDIKLLTSLGSQSGTEIRYILEYRHFTYELLYKIAQILYEFGVKTIYPSTGYFLDDISDNILASALINKKVPDINIICSANIWNDTQVKLAKNSKVYGLKVNSLNALELMIKENSIKN